MNPLTIIGIVFIVLAALIHLYIFVLESLRWTSPSTWKTFGLKSQQDAETVRPMAFNQGFYNLFLAIGSLLGVVLVATGTIAQAGFALAFLAAGSMVLAALVLVLSSPKLARAALIQGAAPLVGIVFLALSLAG